MNTIFIILLLLSIGALWLSLVFYGNLKTSWTVKQANYIKAITGIFFVMVVVFSVISFNFINWRFCTLIMFALVIVGSVIYLDASKVEGIVLLLLKPKCFNSEQTYTFVVEKIKFENCENLVFGHFDMPENKYDIRVMLINASENVEVGNIFSVKIVKIEIVKSKKIPCKKRIFVEQV